MSTKLASVIILGLLVLIIPLARANETTESFSIYTDKQYYTAGDLVNIYVKADSIDPNQTITVTDVIVYDSNNLSVAEWNNISIVLINTTTPEHVGTLNATIEGIYTVSANATGCPWILRAIWHFFCQRWRPKVVPEYPFGTIGAMVALFGATCLYVTRKKYGMNKHS